MDYAEAVDYIHGRYGLGKKVGQSNMVNMLVRLGDPHRGMTFVHVAGTNGKGSTCAYIESVLRAAGYKTGLFTSPYLERYNERVRVSGVPIDDDALARDATDVRAAAEAMEAAGEGSATVFELGTVLALLHFRRENVDVAVIEVGMGGRLDPTNVITPAVCAIARVGLDHMRVLGDTIEAIASEKAGIVKPGVPCALYPQGEGVRRVVREVCSAQGAPLIDLADGLPPIVDALAIPLLGAHQRYNAATAVAALYALRDGGFNIPDDAIREGIAKSEWPGRLESVSGVLIDGAHNPQAMEALCDYLAEAYPDKRITAVVGMMADKQPEAIVSILCERISYAACVRPDAHRALDAEALSGLFAQRGVPSGAYGTVSDALDAARERGNAVVVCGSLYLAGEARGLLK